MDLMSFPGSESQVCRPAHYLETLFHMGLRL